MLNIFASLRVYAGKWAPKTNMVDNQGNPVENPRSFTPDEVSSVQSAIVVPSQYGNSVQFMMIGGGMTFIPLDQNATLSVGDTVDLTKAKILTLCKQGEDDIIRVVI